MSLTVLDFLAFHAFSALLFGCTDAVVDKFLPEGTEAHEELLRIGTCGLVNLAVVAALEVCEEQQELVKAELPEDFMVEDEFCGLHYLPLGGRVVDTQEGECLCDVETEPHKGCLAREVVGDVAEGGRMTLGGLDHVGRRLLISHEDEACVLGAECVDDLCQFLLANQQGCRQALRFSAVRR